MTGSCPSILYQLHVQLSQRSRIASAQLGHMHKGAHLMRKGHCWRFADMMRFDLIDASNTQERHIDGNLLLQ